MRKETFLKNIVGALFMGMMLASCVQKDFYDDLYDEDLSTESLIGRRKFKENGWNGGSLDDAQNWINNTTSAACGECVAYAVSYITGNSLPEVRNAIGPEMSLLSNPWQIAYCNYVNGSGFPTSDRDLDVIASYAGLRHGPKSSNKLKNQLQSIGGGLYKPKNGKDILVVFSDSGFAHTAVLKAVDYSYSDPLILYQDQTGQHCNYLSYLLWFWY